MSNWHKTLFLAQLLKQVPTPLQDFSKSKLIFFRLCGYERLVRGLRSLGKYSNLNV